MDQELKAFKYSTSLKTQVQPLDPSSVSENTECGAVCICRLSTPEVRQDMETTHLEAYRPAILQYTVTPHQQGGWRNQIPESCL